MSAIEHETVDRDHISVWTQIKNEALSASQADPALSPFFQDAIHKHENLSQMIAGRVAARLWTRELSEERLFQIFVEQTNNIQDFEARLIADILAVYDRDPACHRMVEPVLYLKGFLAIQAHRFAHSLWHKGRKDLALFLQGRSSSVFQTDIHPAAVFGKGIFLDHATGFVVGETANIGNNVSILQDVTLGGTGKGSGDRHPKIRCGVLIGAGAKVLGNIEVGDCAKIAAGSVVLKPVPANATVAGVPAKMIGESYNEKPALSMNQNLEE
ncbi:serine O-acetyltransferase [Bartonella tamiae]|uniref:Serine acetyltransferase n=1 Tax=Bartonella tamiae Th239 TaxID=1094558 RepID=J1JUW6_9HYPH|nr:serine O-acetyltransferase [Bartonella tamiae]EJF88767.1 serine O-acetyltransferase [Bartonella tamiae Th239]EJF94983.1 serine O-acetyltransferase [Bartonella tamiae Th307]